MCGLCKVYIQALTLTDVCTTISSHVKYSLLFDLPDSLIQVTQMLRDLSNCLNRPSISHDLVTHLLLLLVLTVS